MEKIKVGVVGIGHMGSYHVRTYAGFQNVELAGVVDIDEERAEKVAKQYNTKAYSDYRQIFDKVEAVNIAVPTSRHYQVAKDFLEAGKHILLEKPATSSLEEAEELLSLAQSKNLVLQIGHVERFNAAVNELKNIVKDPIFIECRRLGPKNSRITDTGVVLDLLIHDVDIILRLVDSKITRMNVAGGRIYSEFEDLANVQLIFDNGCIANLTASRVTEEKIRTLAITQPDAYIFLDYAEQDLQIHRQASSKYILSRELLQYRQESFIERLFVHKDNPLKLELSHFIDCIVNGATPKTTTEEDLRSLGITLKILEKIKGVSAPDEMKK
ncbi:Gfo/Idh/MocA family oxidoreductase [bacterium]|nr:Gfo/Idh/MocA family oxidoreductase [bacterium]MBU1615071.1 Gfo/Idh/MocA family oxidoreductase [bacterium]